MLNVTAPPVAAIPMTTARRRRSQPGRRFWTDTAVEYVSTKDWSSSRAVKTVNVTAPRGTAMKAAKIRLGSRPATVTSASKPRP